MKPSAISVEAVRGFQRERIIPLSPTLTVIYGGNGRGKTSLCEGWHWLFTGQMLEGLEPRSELGRGQRNVHVQTDPVVRLLGSDGDHLAERTEVGFSNSAGLPGTTSPVLLQYRLQQVLYTAPADRRKFFETVLSLEVEAAFAQRLRRACQAIDPFEHDAWKAWDRAVTAVRPENFAPPHARPEDKGEQRTNEEALLAFVAAFLQCDPTPTAIEAALEEGPTPEPLSLDSLRPPVEDDPTDVLNDALAALDDLDAAAEHALKRARWQTAGLDLAEPPQCPFCDEDTADDAKLDSIRAGIAAIEEQHASHEHAKTRLASGVAAVLPLARLDVPTTRRVIEGLKVKLDELDLEAGEGAEAALDALDEALGELAAAAPQPDQLGKADTFATIAPVALALSGAWLALSPHVDALRTELHGRRSRAHYMEAAASLLQYHRADLPGFYRRLDAQPVLREIADTGPAAVNQVKKDRLDRLALDIVAYYRLLRPDDPTPLESIEATAGVRGDFKVLARTKGNVEHASAIFSHSNANAFGMAAHIARVVDAGHETVVLDDPFQSLDDTNRDQAIGALIRDLLDRDIQVVVLTHQRGAAERLLNTYVDREALGTALRWDPEEGAIPDPMYPGPDQQVQVVLDGFERDISAEIGKVSSALRKLVETFCLDYLHAVQADPPPPGRNNLGGFIAALEALDLAIRPSAERLTTLKQWNRTLSQEAHAEGEDAPGMDQLKGLLREALAARQQEKQLRPPGVTPWPRVPRSGGLQRRVREILG